MLPRINAELVTVEDCSLESDGPAKGGALA